MDLERGFLVVAILAFGTLSLILIQPLLQYVLLAILLGYVLYPLHERLAPRVGTRLSAGGLIAATALVIVFLIGVLTTVAAQQALDVIEAIRTGQIGLSTVERFFREQFGVAINLNELVNSRFTPDTLLRLVEQQGGTSLFGGITNLFGGLSNAVIGITVFVFLSYYLLTDGTAFVRWLRDITPMSEGAWRELSARVDQLLWAVLVGNVAVATIQGVLTGIGLAVVGFPNAVLWTIVTIVLGLLPLIGASIVWVPASGYLLLQNQPVAAVVLFIYGITLVSISDNYLRPLVGGHEAGLNPGLFILGISGGLFLFGFLGVFFGPVVLGILEVFIEQFAHNRSPCRRRVNVSTTARVDTPKRHDDDQRAS